MIEFLSDSGVNINIQGGKYVKAVINLFRSSMRLSKAIQEIQHATFAVYTLEGGRGAGGAGGASDGNHEEGAERGASLPSEQEFDAIFVSLVIHLLQSSRSPSSIFILPSS